MTLVARLEGMANPARAAQSAAYHKARRTHLGIDNPVLNTIAAEARRNMALPERLTEARALWASNTHEARILAAKLFDQRRIVPDQQVWALLCGWVRDFDAWAIADHVCKSVSLRLLADPSRLDVVELWTTAPDFWVRRAALVATLHWANIISPEAADIQRRERILGWAGSYAADREWFIQKAIGWWLRELSAIDPDRVRLFLAQHGPAMQPFARKEALRNIKT